MAPPLLIHGKMATENCDAMNMDPDTDLLSDEELERYDKLRSCCQQQKYIYNEVSHRCVQSKVSVMLIFLSHYELWANLRGTANCLAKSGPVKR